ncbi:hypothetical protein HYT57_04315 [Candidatus Woesearchaeota archaeon]|nr:hypothetical protein [Candidatus Woesearchaeota archaeon]
MVFCSGYCGVLTESERPRKYWSDLKKRLIDEGFELPAKIGQLKLVSDDGKSYFTDCVTTKNAFRIIQSIPSKKAEPFKLWLAQVGYERVQEYLYIQHPLAGCRSLLDTLLFLLPSFLW